jgi:hypothetical protein
MTDDSEAAAAAEAARLAQANEDVAVVMSAFVK